MAKFEMYKYERDDENKTCTIVGKSRHIVNLVDYSCDCAFAASTRLTCRHVIALRKADKCEGSVIPMKIIDQR